jgi:hypothetical protein
MVSMMMSRSLAALAVASCAVLASAAPMASAAISRSTEVIPLEGGLIEAGCTEPLMYTGGEVRITEQEATNAAGGRITRIHIHTVGATAVGLETGTRYVDRTNIRQGSHGNGTFYETDFADGSHGVNIRRASGCSRPAATRRPW